MTISSITDSILKLYQEKKYDEALELLGQNKKTIDPGLYHFNMGTLLLKKGELAFGRYHLELGIKKGYYTKESVKNLESSKSLLGVSQFEDLGTWGQLTQVLYTAPWDFYLFFSLLIIAVGAAFWKKMTSKPAKVIWLFLAIIPLLMPLVFHNNQFAIITGKEQPIFEGPSEVFEKSNELPQGIKLVVKDNQDGWYKVLSPERFAGWIKKDSLMLIKD